jgi:hypothetical protein
MIRWSVQKIRRLVMRLAPRRIQVAHVIACHRMSLWRRAHQAAARQAHLKRRAPGAKRRRQRRTPVKASFQTKRHKMQL